MEGLSDQREVRRGGGGAVWVTMGMVYSMSCRAGHLLCVQYVPPSES